MISLIYLLELIDILSMGTIQSFVNFVCLIFALLAFVFLINHSNFIGEVAIIFGEKMVAYIVGYASLSLLLAACFYFGMPVHWLSLAVILLLECSMLYFCTKLVDQFMSAENPDDMAGKEAVVTEWSGKEGKVRFEGEHWKAYTADAISLAPDDRVIIENTKNLLLCVKKAP